MRLLTSIFLLALSLNLWSQSTIDSSKIKDEITFLFLGDIMGHGPQITSALNKESGEYDYSSCFKYITEELSDADYTLGNLEVTLAGPPFKGYPQFSSPDNLALSCKNAGVDILVTSNNHSCDRGGDGIIRTVNTLDTLDIMHTGTFLDSVDRREDHPLIIDDGCFRIAILNYTYGTNGLPYPEPTIVNMLDKDLIKKDMEIAKSKKVDKIIVVTHWGSEYKLQPTQEQVDWGEYIFEQGADMIIGGHPHVIEKMVWTKGNEDLSENEKLIVYSLGNFVSNQRKRYTDGGTLFKVTLKREGDKIFIKNAGYLLTWVYTPIEDGVKKYYILPASKYEENEDFFDTKESYDKMMLFLNDSRELYGNENLNVPEIKYQNKKWVLTE
ncbi:MAG: CapA family protein [Flavobacteriales bacterium]|jgi:poly-gamma-glutamate synthesis protein (capsule biosynthesis protein)|nr:CapA family protein [Flavobacteriales bacterium]